MTVCEICETEKPDEDVELVEVSPQTWHEPAEHAHVCESCLEKEREAAGEQAKAEREAERHAVYEKAGEFRREVDEGVLVRLTYDSSSPSAPPQDVTGHTEDTHISKWTSVIERDTGVRYRVTGLGVKDRDEGEVIKQNPDGESYEKGRKVGTFRFAERIPDDDAVMGGVR